MSIKLKLTLIVGTLSLIIVGMFLITLNATSNSKDDGLIINLAGRQRMLTQKMTKEVIFLDMKRHTGATITAADTGKIKNTMQVFDQTLNALLKGGKAPLSLDLAKSKYRDCPPAQEPAKSQLAKVSSMWQAYSANMENLINKSDNNVLKYLQDNNVPLLKEMNKAVGMMQKQSEKRIKTLLTSQIVAVIIGILFMLYAGLTVRAIISRLNKINALAEKMGQGDLTGKTGVKQLDDELGAIARTMDETCSNLAEMFKKILSNSNNLNVSATELNDLSTNMTAVSSSTSEKSSSVAAATEEMSVTMASVANTTDELSRQVNQVAASSQETAQNISTVAAATEEMSATVTDIASNTEQARTVTGKAMDNVKNASERVDELGGAAMEINKITDVIVEIAEQTKLLALNATIEAARAGEAGKGFAVVANEIKELAAQTNNAIIEIRGKVETMQNSTDNTINEITNITGIMDEVNEIVVNIAGAVEEQSVTTQDVARNISEAVNSVKLMSDSAGVAADGITEIVENVVQAAEVSKTIAFDIEDVNQGATTVNQSAEQLNAQAQEVNSLGGELEDMVSHFKI
jgi:methyl-accepting chemotaxis protein